MFLFEPLFSPIHCRRLKKRPDGQGEGFRGLGFRLIKELRVPGLWKLGKVWNPEPYRNLPQPP